MRATLAVLLAASLTGLLACDAAAQSGRVAPRPAPSPSRPAPSAPRPAPVRPIIVAPIVPHHPRPPTHATTPVAAHRFTPPAGTAVPAETFAVAAAIVGLLGATEGQEALVSASALVARETEQPWTAAEPPPIVADAPRPVQPAPAPSSSSWACPLVAGGFLALVIGLGWAFNRSRRALAVRPRIRITAVPPGEVPDYVRRAWVGLELPLAPGESGPCQAATAGVLSGHREGGFQGYAVAGPEAVQLLAERDTEAAQWWRTEAPHVVRPGFQFVFPAEVCEPA